jgi:hypothetical protein
MNMHFPAEIRRGVYRQWESEAFTFVLTRGESLDRETKRAPFYCHKSINSLHSWKNKRVTGHAKQEIHVTSFSSN